MNSKELTLSEVINNIQERVISLVKHEESERIKPIFLDEELEFYRKLLLTKNAHKRVLKLKEKFND